MYGIGIDVGSTFTKYCVMSDDFEVIECFTEKTPIKQNQYFEERIKSIKSKYEDAVIVSCGYGKGNVNSLKKINELTALAVGANYVRPDLNVILDIGGQDTKIVTQKNGKLTNFFVNDKCAAGSGQFLINALRQLGLLFEDIDLTCTYEKNITLSSTCAVFAQSEIVELIAANVEEKDIIRAVLTQIFTQAKFLIKKIQSNKILISGGLSQIPGIDIYAQEVLGIECYSVNRGGYLASIGCALQGINENSFK